MHFTFKTNIKVLIFKCDGICHCSHTDVQPSCIPHSSVNVGKNLS